MEIKAFINSLQRITSKGDFTPEIDGLRFLAIFPVVIMHINTNYGRVFGVPESFLSSDLHTIILQGGFGVRFFFAISGFVLSNAFAKFFFVQKRTFKEYDLKSYFWRRITRLEPPFLISAILLFFFTGLFVKGSLVAILPNLLATLTYSHVFVYGVWSVVNPVSWSLEVEIQFYLLAPFIGLIFFRYVTERIRILLLVLIIVAAPYLFLFSGSPFIENSHLALSLPVFLSHFFVGVLMASIYNSPYWVKIKQSYWFDLICLAATIGLYAFYPPKVGYYYIFDFCMLLVMICSFKGRVANSFFSNKIISIIGGMCYSIYLIHYAVIFGLMKFTRYLKFDIFYLNWSFNVVISLFAVLIFSIIFYKFCEQPFMDKNWPKKFRSAFLSK